MAKATAPAAAVIQFFGGIHEIYFPYVLMKPILIVATIASGMVGIFTLTIFGAGLRAPAAPGSIIAVYLQTPGGSFIGVTLIGPTSRNNLVRPSLHHPQGKQEDRRER